MMRTFANSIIRSNQSRRPAVWAILLVVCCCHTAVAADTAGKTAAPREAIWIDLYPLDSLHWTAAVYLENSEILAAMTVPLRWGSGDAPFMVDSAVYRDTRLDYFALKTFSVDTTGQMVLLGLISDLGMGRPPLEPGSGLIAWLHFTRTRNSDEALTLDSTFVPPQNTLQLVTPDVRALTPKFQVRRVVPPPRPDEKDHASEDGPDQR